MGLSRIQREEVLEVGLQETANGVKLVAVHEDGSETPFLYLSEAGLFRQAGVADLVGLSGEDGGRVRLDTRDPRGR